MNISGRVISNQGIPTQDNQRVVLKAPTREQGKEHVTGIKTPEGVKEVLNLNKAAGRNALKQAVRDVGEGGRDIYLRVSRTQVIKLHLDQPTTRRQLLKEIATVLNNPSYDIDLKFKAGLARVYHTLTTKSSESNTAKYLKNAPVAELDQKMQALVSEFKKRMPESQETSLRHLLRDYTGTGEALESISSKVYEQRQNLKAKLDENLEDRVQNRVQAYQQNPVAFVINYFDTSLIKPEVSEFILKNEEGSFEELQQAIIDDRVNAFLSEKIEYYQNNPAEFLNDFPEVDQDTELDDIESDKGGCVTSVIQGHYAEVVQNFRDQQELLYQQSPETLLKDALSSGHLDESHLVDDIDDVISNSMPLRQAVESQFRAQAIEDVAYDEVYSVYYNKPSTPHPITETYGGQDNLPDAEIAFITGLQEIAQGRSTAGVSDLQGGSDIIDIDLGGDLSDVKTDFFRFERENWHQQDIRQRVYINVKAEYGPTMMKELVGMIDSQGPDDPPGIEMAKISGPGTAGQRVDTIVVYTSGNESSQQVIARLREIQEKGVKGSGSLPDIPPNGDIFGDETPGMTERVMPGVALGDEPDEATYHGGASFGGLRSDVLFKVALETVDQDIPFEQFHAKVESELKKALINPDRVDRNLV